jgi:micrococcal nuclease
MRRLEWLIVLMAVIQPFAHAELVANVTDGDTFILADQQRVRLADIDAPELLQPYGPEAKAMLAKLIEGKDVTLQCQERRSYGRLVCKVFINTLDIQAEMVGWGLAFDYAKYSGGAYQHSEAFAHRMKRGVWSGGIRPWDYRRSYQAH